MFAALCLAPQAIAVSLPDNLPPVNVASAHVTISVAKGVPLQEAGESVWQHTHARMDVVMDTTVLAYSVPCQCLVQ